MTKLNNPIADKTFNIQKIPAVIIVTSPIKSDEKTGVTKKLNR